MVQGSFTAIALMGVVGRSFVIKKTGIARQYKLARKMQQELRGWYCIQKHCV